jgi:hypothetical protein
MNGSCGNGTCGNLGQGCCSSGGVSTCTASYTTCTGGPSCEPCGGNGQRCCWDWRVSQYLWCASPYKAATGAGMPCVCKP